MSFLESKWKSFYKWYPLRCKPARDISWLLSRFFEVVFHIVMSMGWRNCPLRRFSGQKKVCELQHPNASKERFAKLLKRGIKIHCILGNHDTYFRNTNKVNSLREYFHHNHSRYTKSFTITRLMISLLLLPWINKENYDESVEFIKNTSNYLCSHLELNGSHEGCPVSRRYGSVSVC